MSVFGWLFKTDEVKPMCVENSVFAALTYRMEKKLPVRIVISRFSLKPFTDHAQAQAQINGEWRWLHVTPYSTVSEWDEEAFGPDYGTKEHYKFLTLKEIMVELDGKGLLT